MNYQNHKPQRKIPTLKSKSDAMLDSWLKPTSRGNTNPNPHRKMNSSIIPTLNTNRREDEENKEQIDLTCIADNFRDMYLDDDEILRHIEQELCYITTEVSQIERKESLSRIIKLLNISTDIEWDMSIASNNINLQSLLPPLVNVRSSTFSSLANTLMKPILKRLADPMEKVRQFALFILIHLVSHVGAEDLLSYLPYILPLLNYRMNIRDLTEAIEISTSATSSLSSNQLQAFKICPLKSITNSRSTNDNMCESSEELRSLLLTLTLRITMKLHPHYSADLHQNNPSLISSFSPSSLSVESYQLFEESRSRDILIPYFPSLLNLLVQSLLDPAASLKYQASQVILLLVFYYPHHIRSHSSLLVRFLYNNLVCKHNHIRSITLMLVEKLIPLGAGECIRELTSFREKNIIEFQTFYSGEVNINYFALLNNDCHNTVRYSFYHCLCQLMRDWREKADYETLIIPYIFSGLSDADITNRLICRECLIYLGEEFEKDFPDQVEDIKNYGNMIANVCTGINNNERYKSLSLENNKYFPFPFADRPSVGLRLYTRKFLDRLISAIINEQKNSVGIYVNIYSLCLLRSLLFFCEDHISIYLKQLIEIIYSTNRNRLVLHYQPKLPDFQVDSLTLDIINLIGTFAPTDLVHTRLFFYLTENTHAHDHLITIYLYSKFISIIPKSNSLIQCLHQLCQYILFELNKEEHSSEWLNHVNLTIEIMKKRILELDWENMSSSPAQLKLMMGLNSMISQIVNSIQVKRIIHVEK